MASALALAKGFETKWTALSGGMPGSVRVMAAAQFTLGRSAECEFVIAGDPKVSRRHARVEWSGEQCTITSLNEQNPVMVNGAEKLSAILHDGDRILIGDTELLFNLTNVPAETGVRPNPRGELQMAPPQQMYMPPQPNFGSPMPPPRARPPKKKPMPLMQKVIILVVVLGGILLLLPSGKKKKEEAYMLTNSQIQADIDAANKLAEAAQNSSAKKFEGSITARQAQENFVRGFRDYRKGQFERSLDSFQACLSLDPAHPLCVRYLRLAQRRFNELVQYNVVLGRKYRDQNQFAACRAAFRNVMVMIKDANSITYREAKANYDACNNLVEGRF